jgi:hypothetical protein
VVLSWIKGSGIEAGGAVYDWDGRKVNAGGVTTFQRHAVIGVVRPFCVEPGGHKSCHRLKLKAKRRTCLEVSGDYQ